MTLFDTLFTALRGVTANKLRAALTTLGVIIGVASVIVMLALGNGARAAVEANFRFLGSNKVQISARQKLDDGELVPAGKILSYEDGLLMPAKVELVDRIEMWVQGMGKVRYGRAVLDMSITGATVDALSMLISANQLQPTDWPEGEPLTPDAFLSQGRFFTPSEVLEGANVCVLGSETAQDLFAGDDPIGETIRVDRQHCLVIGVLVEMETLDPEERQRSKPNEVLLMPVSTVVRTLYEEEPSVSVTAHVSDESRMAEAKAQIADYLRKRHGIEKDAEIGIRLAVGARRRDVVAQFLFESVLLSAGGGVLGIAVGILLIPLVATLNQGNALLDPGSIPLAFGVALLTGILFGLYPAAHASRLHPIEALRYE